MATRIRARDMDRIECGSSRRGVEHCRRWSVGDVAAGEEAWDEDGEEEDGSVASGRGAAGNKYLHLAICRLLRWPLGCVSRLNILEHALLKFVQVAGRCGGILMANLNEDTGMARMHTETVQITYRMWICCRCQKANYLSIGHCMVEFEGCGHCRCGACVTREWFVWFHGGLLVVTRLADGCAVQCKLLVCLVNAMGVPWNWRVKG